ncbi:peptide-methionine (R)-S-oxide reductase MsrB [Marinoscillum sp. MHG1-6]|uniref:peptide-methionine (R)-S-oxide reductase MsrB n=1 Tax=Marinoscillum sp. MHG1-6 TaxID=2959627 RepID=UPI002158023B|nr:peptide-methionine (R)-S-oxide reductase MsrB [Marinoscillum sp. MHG1-6]
MSKIDKTPDEWKAELTPDEYRVLREKGTERAWTGELLNNKETGMYECAGCGHPLFTSDTKFDSGSGWPSFFSPVSKDAIGFHLDTSHGMTRTEITCNNCGGHLGHVFHDGPQPTGDRYCVNSISLKFKKS